MCRKKTIFYLIIALIGMLSFSMDVNAITCEYEFSQANIELNDGNRDKGNVDRLILTTKKDWDYTNITYRDDWEESWVPIHNMFDAFYDIEGGIKIETPSSGVTFTGGNDQKRGKYGDLLYKHRRTYTFKGPKNSIFNCVSKESCCPTVGYFFNEKESWLYLRLEILKNGAKLPKDYKTATLMEAKDLEEDDIKPKEVEKCTDEQIDRLVQFIKDKVQEYKVALGWDQPIPSGEELAAQGMSTEEIFAYYDSLYDELMQKYLEIVGGTMDEKGNPKIEIKWTGSGKDTHLEGSGLLKEISDELKSYNCEITPKQKTRIRNTITNALTAEDKGLIPVRRWEIDRAYKYTPKEILSEEEKEKLEEKSKQTEKTIKKITKVFRAAIDEWIDDFNETLGDDCESLIAPELISKIKRYMNWIRIIVPILLIVLGTVDFAKAVLMQEKSEDTNKAFNKFIKRCVIAVAIFFVPTVLSILVDLFNKYNPSGLKITDLDKCIR